MKKIGSVLLAILLLGFVLAGCDDGNGNKKEEEKPKETGFTVTVSDIPPMSGGKLYGASLMAITDPNNPIAIGMLEKGVFTFFHANETANLPDTTKPFTTAGTYLLAIAETELKIIDGIPQPEIVAIYMYTKDGQPGTITFSETDKNVTLAWGDFNEV